jgi:hypothetical protein
MKIDRNKFDVEWLETEQGEKRYARGAYIKVIQWSLIMWGPTGQAAWMTYQLVWLVAIKIG